LRGLSGTARAYFLPAYLFSLIRRRWLTEEAVDIAEAAFTVDFPAVMWADSVVVTRQAFPTPHFLAGHFPMFPSPTQVSAMCPHPVFSMVLRYISAVLPSSISAKPVCPPGPQPLAAFILAASHPVEVSALRL